jgi:hypothetical protein
VLVNPWYTLAFDGVAVAGLIGSLRLPGGVLVSRRAAPRRNAVAALVLLLAGTVSMGAMIRYAPEAMTPEGEIAGDGSLVYLDPMTWVGKAFPLVRRIDLGDRLAKDEWIVVLYRHDCPRCHWAIPEYERLARLLADEPGSPRVALIEVPPFGSPDDPLVSSDSACILGRLDESNEWFVEVPARVRVKDGTVMTAAKGSAAQQIAD